LLEGLEISEIKLSDALNENKSKRLDSTYFIKHSLAIDKNLRDTEHFFIKEAEVVSGPFGSTLKSHSYQTEGVPFVRVQNIKGGFEIQKNDIIYISEDDNTLLKNSQLGIDDLVLSKVGNSIGYYARVDEEIGHCNISENNIGIKLKSYDAIRRHYILTFLNSSYGTTLTLRKTSGNAQPKLNVSDITEIPIPVKSKLFETKISNLILSSRELKKQAVKIYLEAEIDLLKAVGLVDFKPSTQNTNIKTFTQSFVASGRLDAEYYQPKYEDYIKLIFDYKDGWAKLSDICTLKDYNYNPNDQVKYKYIELSDIDKSGGVTGCTFDFGVSLPSRARRLVNTGDVVISSIEGSLSSCALVGKEYDNALCSTGFYVINSYEINSETLLVLMKSELMQNILKQNCSGTILTAINKDEFTNIPIPKIDKDTQTKISKLVQESFSLKAESERLLEVAKRAVEIAIELDEEIAVQYINKNSHQQVH